MSNLGIRTNATVLSFGYWSAVLIGFLFIVFTVCFVGIALTAPVFPWTDLAGGIGFALDLKILLFLTINFGMGGAVLVAAIALARHFRQI